MANDTPESDFSIECFQNYTAPEVFVQGLAGIVNQTDVEEIIRAQKNMLQRFEKTTEMLTNCNQLSANRLRTATVEFKKHAQVLMEMQKDLNYIFKKIKAIKTKLSTQYPQAYKEAVANDEKRRSKRQISENEETNDETDSTVMDVEKTAGAHSDKTTVRSVRRMLATVSTETLKPEDIKAKQRDSNGNEKPTKQSSSSETESASSGDDSSTDTV